MADKVLRFTAEDSGYGAAIDRMAGKLRSAFGNAGDGMSSILNEADAKFTNFADKLKFVKEQLETIKGSSETERAGAVKEAIGENTRLGGKRTNDSVQREVSREYEREEKVLNRLIDSLDRFGERVEEASKRQEEHDEQPPTAPPAGEPPEEKPPPGYGGGFADFLGGALQVATGFEIARLGERLIGAITGSIKEGTDLARQEYVVGRQLTLPDDLLNDRGGRSLAPNELGVNNKQFLDAINNTAASRRSGNDVLNTTLGRLRLTSGYGVSQGEFAGLDKFYRLQSGGGTLDRNDFDANRTITEILVRADRQGILGVSKGDFTMLPEKIGQVTAFMQQQYGSTERTNANQAVNLTLAGNRIGGFFDRDPAGTFGKLNEGITNPHSGGMRAYILEALRRANPNITSPLQLEALQQEGLSNEGNVRAIFGALQNVRSREVRGRILQQGFGLDAQSAFRLSGAENLQTFIQGAGTAGGGALSPTDLAAQNNNIQQRAENLTLSLDKATSYVSNSLTSFGIQLQEWTEKIFKERQKLDSLTINPDTKINTNKVAPAAPAGK